MVRENRPAFVVILFFVVGAFVLSKREIPVNPPVANLSKFDGVTDNDTTDDPVVSDLSVRAHLALEAGDAKTAEALYRRLVAHEPNDPDNYSSLAACLYFQKNYQEAIAVYEQALQIDPKSGRALYGLGSVASKQDKNDLAIEYLKRSLAVQERNAKCHRLLGMVYQDVGDRPAAIAHFKRALEVAVSPAEVDDVVPMLTKLINKTK